MGRDAALPVASDWTIELRSVRLSPRIRSRSRSFGYGQWNFRWNLADLRTPVTDPLDKRNTVA